VIHRVSEQRWVWLAAGLLGGACISYFWPHEPALAVTNDRADKFGLATCMVQPSFAGAGELEGIFVLDYLTGRLVGSVLSPKDGKFNHAYFRNVAADFAVNPKDKPAYAMVAGRNQIVSRGGVTLSTGVMYVGELKSGKIAAYAFPYNDSIPAGPIPMEPIAYFPFREAANN
jgi:hypothetical protein